jgi:hypothetical protein
MTRPGEGRPDFGSNTGSPSSPRAWSGTRSASPRRSTAPARAPSRRADAVGPSPFGDRERPVPGEPYAVDRLADITGRDPKAQGDVLGQNGCLQGSRLGAGFQTQLVNQDASQPLKGAQGVGLAAGAV